VATTLDGRLRPVRGVLPCLLAARSASGRRGLVPAAALPEAALVEGIDVHGARGLAEVLAFLRGDCNEPWSTPANAERPHHREFWPRPPGASHVLRIARRELF